MSKKAHQKLSAWLAVEGRKKSWLASQVSVRPNAVTAWVNGKSIPIPALRERIEEVTNGAVSAQEWGK